MINDELRKQAEQAIQELKKLPKRLGKGFYRFEITEKAETNDIYGNKNPYIKKEIPTGLREINIKILLVDNEDTLKEFRKQVKNWGNRK